MLFGRTVPFFDQHHGNFTQFVKRVLHILFDYIMSHSDVLILYVVPLISGVYMFRTGSPSLVSHKNTFSELPRSTGDATF